MSSGLRADIKQTGPFVSLEQEVFLNLLRTSAVLEYEMGARLREFGLTLTQYNALRILRGAGSEGLCRNEVRDRMLRSLPDATRLLDRLAELELVERVRDGEDRRYVSARITRQGLELLARLDAPVARLHRKQLGHMKPEELRQLSDLLAAARRK